MEQRAKKHEGYTAPGRARAKYLWLAPSKVRRLLPHLKGRPVQDAIDLLAHTVHRSSEQLQKVIKSARANYMQQFPQISADSLYLKNIYSDEGPRVKRIWRRGRGRADVLLKRMCHITALVDVRENIPKSKSKRHIRATEAKVPHSKKDITSPVAGVASPAASKRDALTAQEHAPKTDDTPKTDGAPKADDTPHSEKSTAAAPAQERQADETNARLAENKQGTTGAPAPVAKGDENTAGGGKA